jgi:hypothetical protein
MSRTGNCVVVDGGVTRGMRGKKRGTKRAKQAGT